MNTYIYVFGGKIIVFVFSRNITGVDLRLLKHPESLVRARACSLLGNIVKQRESFCIILKAE